MLLYQNTTNYQDFALFVSSKIDLINQNKSNNTQIATLPKEFVPTDTIEYNYTGKIGGSEIHAWIEFLESYHHESTGQLIIPLKGYYFYPKYKMKVPIYGEQRLNRISFFSEINGVQENFEGDHIDFEKISGSWTRKSKTLSFHLRAIKI